MELQPTKKLINHFRDFLGYHPPRRISRNLRKMLFDYLAVYLKNGLPTYYDELIQDLDALFVLLDMADDQMKKAKKRLKKHTKVVQKVK